MTNNRRYNVCVLDARIIKWRAPRPSAVQMRFSVDKTDGFRSWPGNALRELRRRHFIVYRAAGLTLRIIKV